MMETIERSVVNRSSIYEPSFGRNAATQLNYKSITGLINGMSVALVVPLQMSANMGNKWVLKW